MSADYGTDARNYLFLLRVSYSTDDIVIQYMVIGLQCPDVNYQLSQFPNILSTTDSLKVGINYSFFTVFQQ